MMIHRTLTHEFYMPAYALHVCGDTTCISMVFLYTILHVLIVSNNYNLMTILPTSLLKPDFSLAVVSTATSERERGCISSNVATLLCVAGAVLLANATTALAPREDAGEGTRLMTGQVRRVICRVCDSLPCARRHAPG